MKWTDPQTEIEAILDSGDLLSLKRQRKSLKTHCKYGHEFTEENTLWSNEKLKKKRYCRKCRKAAWSRHRATYRAKHRGDKLWRYTGKSIESLRQMLNKIESRAVLIRTAIEHKESKAQRLSYRPEGLVRDERRLHRAD